LQAEAAGCCPFGALSEPNLRASHAAKASSASGEMATARGADANRPETKSLPAKEAHDSLSYQCLPG